MKGHNQNKYLHNYIKSNNPTHAEWTECRIKLGRKDLALQLSPECACVPGSLPARRGAWTLCDGKGPGVVIPGLHWVLWIIPHQPQGQV